MSVGARLTGPDGQRGAMSVKGAVGYDPFNGVPQRLLTTCDIHINGEFFLTGYVLLVGPGLR